MMHRFGIDVDGVLADFAAGYNARFVVTTGRDLFTSPPMCWDYELAAGYTKEDRSQVWAQIRSSPTFWLDLPALPGAATFLLALKTLSRDTADVYFLTTRLGSAKTQTERWLKRHGFPEPTVIVNRHGDKGPLAQALDLTAVLDDKPENLADIRKTHPRCRTILRRATWNHACHDYEAIEDLMEFFKRAMR